MATHQPFKPRPLAFLNWKGLRRWSVGRRAPSLCKLFYNARSSPKVGLVLVGKLLSNIKSSSATAAAAATTTTATTVTEAASRAASGNAPASPPRALQVQLSSASNAATTIKRSISYSNNNNITPVGAMALANCLRRNSDAIAPPPRPLTSYRRFSVDSHPYTAAYRLSSENHDHQQVPKILRLGSSSAESAPAHTAERSIMFMGSPAVAKVKETCARILTVAAQHSAAHHHPVLLGDLFVGNPFLTRVSPAPVSSSAGGAEQVTPSFGLLDASVKCRDSELKDRIVFFL